MDADNFIWIFIIVGATIFGFIQSITKKTKEMAEAQETKTKAAQDFQDHMRQEAMKMRQAPAATRVKPMKKTAVQPEVKKVSAPMSVVEGERVTKVKAKPIEAKQETENPLRDKGNLVRALIYGDILKPRF